MVQVYKIDAPSKTMAAGEPVKVTVVTERTPNVIKCSKDLTAEELCIILCKKYNIPPLTRTLFALRIRGKDHFLKDNSRVLSSTRDYELRIRFKVPRLSLLITLDETTYDYYFQQARNDVYENKIPEIKYPDHKKELLGLGIADMTRAILEEKLSMKDVVQNYKKYIPKVIVKKHGPFLKKYAHDYIPQLCSLRHDVNHLKNLYLQQVYALAPNYLAEEYDNVIWQNGEDMVPVRIIVAPFHPHQPGIRLFNTIKRDWFHVCTIEELIYLTRNGDNSLEVSRRGTPLFFKFNSEEQLSSFISLCDAYYRLMVKWTFNLSKDDETPSLKELQRIKCHGPVGGAFSYRKLEEKRSKKHGCYILRQCQDDYNFYYLDVCTKNNTTETYKVEFMGHCYKFNNVEYFSIDRLVAAHPNPEGRIFLNECIPPSEYDKSQLLLCGEPQKKGVRVDQAELQEILKDNKSPRCLPNKDILLYTGPEGGLRFSLKQWDPTIEDGVNFKVYSEDKLKHYSLSIADKNEKLVMHYKDELRGIEKLLINKTLPHLIRIGRWEDFRLQMLEDGLKLTYGRKENTILEWKTDNAQFKFKPTYTNYETIGGHYIGVYFPDPLCHIEMAFVGSYSRIYSIGVWRENPKESIYHFTLHLQGTGSVIISLLQFPGSEKIGSENITATYKALWRLGETKKLVVAFKTLQREKANDNLKDFIELASRWSCVQSSSIVRLYGVTLSSPTALVLEWLPYGPFDHYLRENEDKIQPIHLKKVAAGLARALWDLSEAGVVHGYIRCYKLLLAARDADRISVKLSGPTLRQYKPEDVHWMPVDFFTDMNMARRSVVGDIWAFATTLWEVFSFGQSPTETNPVMTARSYKLGDRLLKPARCPKEVWEIMRHCWQSDPLRPQEIMRDMNHMLHREYVPVHEYEEPRISYDYDLGGTVASDRFIPSEVSGDTGSNKSLISEDSSAASMNGTMTDYNSDNGSSHSLDNINPLSVIRNEMASRSNISLLGCGMRGLEDPDDLMARNAPLLMESILWQGRTHLVTLVKRIGSGNYGQVFKGWIEGDNQESHGKEVAVKKLTQQDCEGNRSLYADSKNELEIMKSLSHVNIVEILGYWLDGLELVIVMEYMEQGSLNYYLKFQGDKLRNSHLIKYAKDIASGMDHISAKNMVHRDLASRNILVVNEHHVKITDFGLARIIPKEESEYRLKTDRMLPIKWYAPESAVKPFHFSTKSDVWSYGVTAWEIFTRARVDVPPFDIDRPTERASSFQIPEGCPSEIYRHLMRNCWNLQPESRPKFIDLVHTCKRFLEEYK